MSETGRTELTFHYERFRAVTAGIIETAGTTFLLLIAVRWFEAGAIAKSLIAAGTSFGMLSSPLVVSLVSHRQWPASRAAAWVFAIGSVGFVAAAAFPVLPIFVGLGALAMACSSAVLPLLTQIYQDNYPAKRRGRLFSRTFVIRIATSVGFSYLAGGFLGDHLTWFRWLLVFFATAFAGAGWCLWRIPSRPIANDRGSHPLRALRVANQDALFRRTLISWMILGFANLMMLPLRVEYLANRAHGLVLTVATVTLLAEVIPNLARLCMSAVWGWLFDHMNFFALRAILNLGFAIGIVTFFVGESRLGLVIGAIVYGMSRAGGDVAWSLWVTKLAPPDRVADYMSVHTFLTGVRGVVAPIVGFQALRYFSLESMGWFSAALIVIATAMLLPEIKTFQKVREGQPLVEEVSE
ncbi:MFS transporter [bacterium]|nr:MFS transporter [bacterium]